MPNNPTKEFGFADTITLTLAPGATSSGVTLRLTYKHTNYNVRILSIFFKDR